MIAGLPWATWLLLAVAVGTGLSIELVYYFRGRSRLRVGGRRQYRSDDRPAGDGA